MPGARKITAVAIALLLVGACGGGDKKNDAAKGGDPTTEAVTDESTTSSSTPGAEGGASTATTAKPGATPGAAGAAGATTTTKPGSSTAATTASGSPRFAAAGGYIVKRTGTASGTSRDAEASFTVFAPTGDDQRLLLSYGEAEFTDQTVRSRSGAIELVHLRTQTPFFGIEFRPSLPVLFAPDPLAVGRTWSWRMTSTDGKVTVDGSFKVLRNENVAVGSEQVATTAVEANLTFSGDVTGTSKQTVWASPKYRLVVQTDDVTDLTKPFVFHAESRSTLTSTTPR